MNAQFSNPAIYKDLDAQRREIRLLTIKPSTMPNSVVECLLETAFLIDDIQFVALSYTWGDARVTENIVVNGFEVPVTTNLAAALRQLRIHWAKGPFPFDKLPSWLWADALCINQGDMSERSSQVRIMGDIYQRAEKVISWLGPEADRSTLAMSTIWCIFREIASLGKDDNRFAWLERYPALTSIGADQPNIWYDIDVLWTRDYWSRVWVLQETVLAKDILLVCGAAPIIPWICVLTIHSWAAKIKYTDPRPPFITAQNWRMITGRRIFNAQPVDRVQLLRRVWHQDNHEREVKGMGYIPLSFSQELKATNPRDNVFGLLGVMNVGIIPDYSISVRDLYTETASNFLRQNGLRRVLSKAGRVQLNPYDLPTWVPDWSRDTGAVPVSSQLSAADSSSSESVNLRVEGSILKVAGIRLSHVRELEPEVTLSPTHLRNGSCIAWHLSTRYLERHGDGLYITGIPPLQAVLRLLIQDEDFLNGGTKLQIPSDNFFTVGLRFVGALCAFGANLDLEFSERCNKNLPRLGLATDEKFAATFSKRFLGADSPLGPWESSQTALYGDFSAYLRVESQLNTALTRNRIFHTVSGYLGVGPDTMQPGDLLYGLKDCVLPVILRQIDSHYELVGTCLVQGLMQGELRTKVDQDLDLEQIEIH